MSPLQFWVGMCIITYADVYFENSARDLAIHQFVYFIVMVLLATILELLKIDFKEME